VSIYVSAIETVGDSTIVATNVWGCPQSTLNNTHCVHM